MHRLGVEGSAPKSFWGILGEGEEFPSAHSAGQGTDHVSFLVGANDLGAPSRYPKLKYVFDAPPPQLNCLLVLAFIILLTQGQVSLEAAGTITQPF